jgi:hypothetical protein
MAVGGGGEPPGREHLPAHCCCHVFTPWCPLDCLEVVLSTATFHALVRAEPAPVPPLATVGQVAALLRAGRLGDVAGIGPRRLGEIEAGLVLAGMALTPPAPAGGPGCGPGCGPDEPAKRPAVGAGQMSAPGADWGEVPGLTLVLPGGLDKDRVVAGLAEAIGRACATIAGRARLFRQRTGDCAARGNTLGQALFLGQALASEEAAEAVDEAIVEVFGLWGQYGAHLAKHRAQDSGPLGPPPARPPP